MVRITEDLIRKKAEHNEGLIGTLEELSLHQEDVEKIEHLNNWCKEIQILYLQSNLISRIENLNKLKKLQYLNLAINNIEKVENLQRCESLEKLDLTLNFIGDLQSVGSLRNNGNLKHFYLTGNPCCDFYGYREFVICVLPQLVTLDGTEITKSERIKARQRFGEIEEKIKQAQVRYFAYRKAQKQRFETNYDPEVSDDDFWKSSSEHCPETRVEISRRSRKGKNEEKEDSTCRRSVSLFRKDGRPLNVNQAKLNFKLTDDNEKLILDLAVYKYLDINFISVDLQPIYARVCVKGKIFQMVFSEEILVDKSTAKRSKTTGHLVLEMPKANYKPLKAKSATPKIEKKNNFLEVEERSDLDFSKIVENNCKMENPEVPPLEYC